MAPTWISPLAFILIVLWGCVPTKEIADAPCPCPEEDGFTCCNGRCVAIGTVCDTALGGTATDSSNDAGTGTDDLAEHACHIDSDCRKDEGEVCISWKDADGNIAGPKVCRRSCGGQTGCSGENEICELTLHDGLPFDSVNVTLACLDTTPPAGCGAVGCRDCADAPFGTTFCTEESDVAGCFIAIDPVCGLYCQSVVLDACGEDTCEMNDAATAATCEATRGEFFTAEMCQEFPCDDCAGPGEVSECVDGTVTACLRFPIPESDTAPCAALCVSQPFAGCE